MRKSEDFLYNTEVSMADLLKSNAKEKLKSIIKKVMRHTIRECSKVENPLDLLKEVK